MREKKRIFKHILDNISRSFKRLRSIEKRTRKQKNIRTRT